MMDEVKNKWDKGIRGEGGVCGRSSPDHVWRMCGIEPPTGRLKDEIKPRNLLLFGVVSRRRCQIEVEAYDSGKGERNRRCEFFE